MSNAVGETLRHAKHLPHVHQAVAKVHAAAQTVHHVAAQAVAVGHATPEGRVLISSALIWAVIVFLFIHGAWARQKGELYSSIVLLAAFVVLTIPDHLLISYLWWQQ